MSVDLRRAFTETFDAPVPQAPMGAIRQRSLRASARATARLRMLVAAAALTSAFTLTYAFEHYVPASAPVPVVSSTPAPLVT